MGYSLKIIIYCYFANKLINYVENCNFGAGIAGHTAATHLRRKLGNEHEILVVSPNSNYQWVPSNIWVGVGRMSPNDVKFPLAPLYKNII